MKEFRLIRNFPSSAADNMARDKEIFLRYLDDGVATLRIYRWEKPAFTYGISQHPENEIDLEAARKDGVEIAPRITGGGVLFHYHELTYSLVCSKDDIGEDKSVFVDYRKICSFLINFYSSLGLKANFALESNNFKNHCTNHELCSAAHEKYDLVINGKKIGGNAQKRRRAVIFQHGSIPISIDWEFVRRYTHNLPQDIASSVTTLAQELKVVLEIEILEQKFITAFSSTFNVRFNEDGIAGPCNKLMSANN